MKRNLLFAFLCIVALPFLSLPTPGDRLAQSGSPGQVAFAGHTIGGVYCPCDPVNDSCGCCGHQRISESPTVPGEGRGMTKGSPPPTAEPDPDSDIIAGALFLALGLFLWRVATISIL